MEKSLSILNFNKLKHFGIFFLAGLWVFVAAEIFLRVFAPQIMLPRYIQAGEFGIRVNMPNQRYTHRTPEYSIEIRTNSQGIRSNDDIPYEKENDVKRIVVLGDSFAMGYGVSLDDTFTEQLRVRLVQELGQKVQIVNLAVSGYGTAEDLIMLKNEGLRYQPDLVLVTWHRTDLDDNLRSHLFTIKNNELTRLNKAYLPAVKIREKLFSYSLYRWLVENSHLYNWIRENAAIIVKRMLAVRKRNRSTSKTSSTLDDASYKVTLALMLLNEIKKQSNNNNASFLLFDIPVKVERSIFKSSMPEDIHNSFNVVSPINEFQKYSGKMLYWEKSAGHFTSLGCKIVGRLIADKIIQEGLLSHI